MTGSTHRYFPSGTCTVLIAACFVFMSVSLLSCAILPRGRMHETFGSEVNPTGDAIGGGKGYRNMVTGQTFFVATAEELLDALAQAEAGEIVYVSDMVEIDLSGTKNIEIPGGVILASGRGEKDGALVYTTDLDASPLFTAGGENVRITGLRLRGPDPERRTDQMRELNDEEKYYSIPNSMGIKSSHPFLEVDNCELWGWSHSAVFLKKGAGHAHIHHNFIHHNQRSGLGYGVCLDKADALIEANIFDWNRHHIAGTGRHGTSYEARYNLCLGNANGHLFDMHGGADREDGTDVAGDWMQIHHNTFKATHVSSIIIRGLPSVGAEVHHNWFFVSDPEVAIGQAHVQGNLRIYRNLFGRNRTLIE